MYETTQEYSVGWMQIQSNMKTTVLDVSYPSNECVLWDYRDGIIKLNGSIVVQTVH